MKCLFCRKVRKNNAKSKSGHDSKENSASSPTPVLPTVEEGASDHYQQLQIRNELHEQRQYEQLPQTQYEQL